ncbi:MAG TPA: helix-turn-helix domain-containing protein [Vicinamibacteria bacterium]|jgi:DNA-binding protein Fis|nr:helix-turn-helix domain-containing protein [Vicinamibacteria bacterium]
MPALETPPGDLSAAAAPLPPVSPGAVPSSSSVLPRTVHGKLQRLKLVTTEAQELARDLKAHLGNYERELVRSALDASRASRSRPPSASVNGLPHRLNRQIIRLEVIADEVKDLVKDLVEDLRQRVEAYQRELGVSGDEHPAKDLKTKLEEYERELVFSALKACGMNQLLAARLLGVLPTTLSEKMKRLGLRGGVRRRSAKAQERGSAPSCRAEDPEPNPTR